MDTKEKVVVALKRRFNPAFIHVDDVDGITGLIVSDAFDGRSSMDRQQEIRETLEDSRSNLSQAELRQVLVIAGLTVPEYDLGRSTVRVHQVRRRGHVVEVVLHGGLDDARYVRDVLDQIPGVVTSEPFEQPGDTGVFYSLKASRPQGDSLDEDEVRDALTNDGAVEFVPTSSGQP